MTIHDQLTTNFYRWEQRGRGVELFPVAVEMEPPFVTFPGHRLRLANEGRDAGARTTFLSRLADRAFRALQPPKAGRLAVREPAAVDDAEPEPDWFGEKEPVIEISLRLPGGVAYPEAAMSHFLMTLSLSSGIVGLELIGTAEEITLQLACQPEDSDLLMQQLEAQFPDAKADLSFGNLLTVWQDDEGLSERLVLDFGLHREFMRPLETGSRIDPFVSLIGGMSHLGEGEAAVYQCLFTPLRAPWAENALAAVTKENGKPFFDDGADLVKETEAKVSHPLYGVVLRLASKADSLPRAWEIVRGMAPALRVYSREGGQSLMPLSNKDYDNAAHCDDLLGRRSRRCGMVLNLLELVALAHWPSPAVKSPKLNRLEQTTTRPAPEWSEEEFTPGTIVLGTNIHDGEENDVVLDGEQRLHHQHVIGGSGTGKSTLLLSLLAQDLEYDRGFALLDPHGDLADAVLARIPEERLDDVVIIDPSDEEHILPFNVLSAHTEYEKTLLASDLVSVFRRLSTSWGDRMDVIYKNLLLAFLEHPKGGTLADMRRFLVDASWRAAFLDGIDDADIQFYWRETFPKLDGPKSIGPILTRLETLLTPKPIRQMVSQQENRLDFNEIMDEGRILIVRLPMGQIGKEIAWMLGSLVMVKLQQAAMARARMPAAERRPFYCYIDECQHFVTPSMAEILAGARKYGLAMVLAHQSLEQIAKDADVEAAVMSNVSTRIVFRVSESDGRALKGDFAHYEPKDFSALGRGQAICRIGQADQDFNLLVTRPEDVDENLAGERREAAYAASRAKYTITRSEIEAQQQARMAAEKEQQASKPKKGAKTATEAASEAKAKVPAEELGTSQVSDSIAEVVETESTPAIEADHQSQPTTSETKDAPPRPSGMGRGGDDHQMIVEQLARAGSSLGYKAAKEASRPGGRADLTLENRRRRIAIEVAIRSNTAEELDHLTNALEAGFDFVVSVSPLENVRLNIEKAAKKKFTKPEIKRLRFLTPEAMLAWLDELAEEDTDSTAPPPDEIKRIGGRSVRIKHRETSPEERRKVEVEQIEVIAKLVTKAEEVKP